MEWNVYYHDWNGKRIVPYNVFQHGGFKKDVDKYLKECDDREEFASKVKSSLMYYFWSKCEWEIVVAPWIPHKDYNEAIKIDVYDQVMLNFERFIDYLWESTE